MGRDSAHISGTFFGKSGITIHPVPLLHGSHEWLLFLLLFMAAVITLIHFMVRGKLIEIVANVFSFGNIQAKLSERFSFSSGMVLSSVFFLNFLLVVSSFFYLTILLFVPSIAIKFSHTELFFTILLILFIYIVFIRGMMWIVTKLLGLNNLMWLHVQVSNNTEFLTGVLLLPFLLLYIYTSSLAWIVFIAVLLAILLFIKWGQLFIFGYKTVGISPVHLFLYLCTLEMVPLLVVIKLLGLDVLF